MPQFTCNVCPKKFFFEAGLLEHRTEHIDNSRQCPFCRTLIREVDLPEHMKVHHIPTNRVPYTIAQILNQANRIERVRTHLVQRLEQEEDVENVPSGAQDALTDEMEDDEEVGEAGGSRELRNGVQREKEQDENLSMDSDDIEPSTSQQDIELERDDMEGSSGGVYGMSNRAIRAYKRESSKLHYKNPHDEPSTSNGISNCCHQTKKQKKEIKLFSNGLVCCARPLKLRYNVANVICDGFLEDCRIPQGGDYMGREVEGRKKEYCLKCFKSVKEERDTYKHRINTSPDFEEILTCSKCQQKWHRCCSTHIEEDTRSFICERCSEEPTARKTLSDDPRMKTELSKKIEERLNSILQNPDHPIRVRTVLSAEKKAETRSLAPELYLKKFLERYGEQIPYRVRAIFVFQRQDGLDLLFFILYAVEFQYPEGTHQEENYFIVDYLDSVAYMKGRRGEVYQETILVYFQFLASIGLRKGFLWSKPPLEGDDYIFNIHPATQQYLAKEKLEQWYNSLLKKGKEKKIVEKFLDFEGMQNKEKKMKTAVQLPLLLEESLWTKAMKDAEKKLENFRGRDRKQAFDKKMEEHFEDHQTDNFFIELAKTSFVHKEVVNICEDELLLDRVQFLEMCKEDHLEWVDERRARYSSLVVIEMLEEALKMVDVAK